MDARESCPILLAPAAMSGSKPAPFIRAFTSPLTTSSDNGSSWTYTLSGNSQLPHNFFEESRLNSASSSSTVFIAGGSYDTNTGQLTTFPLLARSTNNGQSWAYPIDDTFTLAQVSDFSGDGVFESVTCDGTTCLAGGSYRSGSLGQSPILAQSADGGLTWNYKITSTTPSLPLDFANPDNGFFNSVSCSGAICIAAGGYDTSLNSFPLIASSQDSGQTWAYKLDSTNPAMTTDTLVSGFFNSARCKGAICIAAGTYYNGTTDYPLLATSKDGGLNWAYTINSVSPLLPTGYRGQGVFTGTGMVGSSAFVPDSLKFLIHK